MFRFSRLVCAVAVCTLVTLVLADNVKIKGFDTASFGLEAPDADGMAHLKYKHQHDKTKVQIIISGFTPNTNYLFTFQSPSHCLVPGGGLITDEDGHATFDAEIPSFAEFGDCGNGDWTDADIVFTTGSDDGPIHAIARNPS